MYEYGSKQSILIWRLYPKKITKTYLDAIIISLGKIEHIKHIMRQPSMTCAKTEKYVVISRCEIP